jgi:hypothetical protein
MTKTSSRQLLALAVVLAGLIVVVIARRSDGPAAPAAAPSNAARGSAAAIAKAPPIPVVADVKLELLKSDQSELGPSTRNPFQFRAKAPPPPPPRPSGGLGARGAVPVIVEGPPPPPPGPPPPPPITLKYIGVLDTAIGKVAVFRDAGGDIINGKEGDIIDGRYRLLKIGVESADLAYLDGRGRQTIRLSGQ